MASSTPEDSVPNLPFPISCISSGVRKYFLFDINVITWLRREHHILGVLIGTLPQFPQQNIFSGLPLELMPEEARLLVEIGIAYIVYDKEWHQEGVKTLSKEQFQAFQQDLTMKGMETAKSSQTKRMEITERALKRLDLNKSTASSMGENSEETLDTADPTNDSESLFVPSELQQAVSSPTAPVSHTKAWAITPTTAHPPLPVPPVRSEVDLPAVKASSYALFRHLHTQGYYMSPGLRFGCQYTAYPGDPLRFHSHFLAVGVDWDEKLELMNIVGGGRLGTGVKKGFLLGGPEESGNNDRREEVRTFCIEWAGM